MLNPQQDLNSFVKILQPESAPKVPKKSYAPPANEVDEVSEWFFSVGFPLLKMACIQHFTHHGWLYQVDTITATFCAAMLKKN